MVKLHLYPNPLGALPNRQAVRRILCSPSKRRGLG